jgi:maleylacetate reductase
VRFGAGSLADLGEIAADVRSVRPLLVTTARGAAYAPRIATVAVYDGVQSHVPERTVREAVDLARRFEADGLVGLGGGSAIDTCKAVSAELDPEGGVPTIAVPTTYAGAEWTPYYGMSVAPGEKGGGLGVRPVAAVYDAELTLSLPLPETVGTAMNALAHCAEAYYAQGANKKASRDADCGATAIAYALPLVVESPGSIYARTRLLEGAMRAAFALGRSGLALGHAMAQALGGRYGLPHGAMNALCLPAALEFNRAVVPEEVERFGRILGTDDPAQRVRELASLGGFDRLRDFGVPEEDLPVVAAAAAARPGARLNPRPVSASDVERLLTRIW